MNESAPAPADRRYDFRMLPIDRIDPPEVAMRRSMDDRKLADLAASIREDGLRQPIGVVVNGDRYRVSFGHRRRVACEMAGERMIPCFVYDSDGDAEERFKIQENWLREDTNPAEEAVYFKHQLENRYAGDILRMCRALGVKESRVNDRLDLLRLGFDDVFDALQRRKISLAVAKELNKIKHDGYRRLVLGDAVGEGMTSSAVQARRIQIERQLAAQAAGSAAGDAAPPTSEVPIQSVDRCLLCDSAREPNQMIYVRVHRDCLSVAERAKGAE